MHIFYRISLWTFRTPLISPCKTCRLVLNALPGSDTEQLQPFEVNSSLNQINDPLSLSLSNSLSLSLSLSLKKNQAKQMKHFLIFQSTFKRPYTNFSYIINNRLTIGSFNKLSINLKVIWCSTSLFFMQCLWPWNI